MANILDNRNVTDKFGRTRIIEPTFAFNTTTEGVELTVNGGTPNGISTALVLNDFWRKSSVSPTTLPTAINSFTIKPNNSNDTTSFIQRGSDIFFGGADGLVRAGQGAGNIATNTVFGKNALSSNTSGVSLVALGISSLQNNTTGRENISIGANSMRANISGSNSVSIGHDALRDNTTSSSNVAVGATSMMSATGSTNTGVGTGTLMFSSGSGNSAFGYFALRNNTTGGENMAIGSFSMNNNTTGIRNVGIGFASLQQQTTASYNTAIGYQSGQGLTTGSENCIFGSYAGLRLTTGLGNVVMGSNGGGVPGFGANILGSTASANASRNVLIGNASSGYIEENENTIIGFGSGYINKGTKNVMLGAYTYAPGLGNGWATVPVGYNISRNTFIGSDINANSAKQVIIGNNNSALGYGAMLRIAGITNTTCIGANSVATKSNQVVIGDSNVTEVLLSGKLAIDINAIFVAADNTPIVVKTVSGVRTITI